MGYAGSGKGGDWLARDVEEGQLVIEEDELFWLLRSIICGMMGILAFLFKKKLDHLLLHVRGY